MLSEERIELLIKYYKWRQKQGFHKLIVVRNFISILVKSILNIKYIYTNPEIRKHDILMLHPAERSINKKASFINLLQKKGFTIAHEVTYSPFKILLKRKLSEPDSNIPLILKFFASYSKYLIKKYRPKVLITFMDASILSPFLRYEMRNYGKVINIAHGFTAKTWLFSMTDYDYYFIFGKKSLESLQQNNVRFGNTNVILGGSIFVDSNFTLPLTSPNKNILFFSQWVENEHKDVLLKCFDIITHWARQNPDYSVFIKLHPKKDTDYWEDNAKHINNIKILNHNISMIDALKPVSLTITVMSAASIESALLNRPFVIVNDSNMSDHFLNAEDFFLPRAKTVDELNDRIKQTFTNYEKYLKKCDDFSSFHLAKKQGSMEFIADTVEKIFNDEAVPSIQLPENIQRI